MDIVSRYKITDKYCVKRYGDIVASEELYQARHRVIDVVDYINQGFEKLRDDNDQKEPD